MPKPVAETRRILVVDDNADLREMLSDLLALEGSEVVCSADGSEAIKYLRLTEELPDAIVLDYMMPVMSAPEFLAEKRGDPRLAPIPVILLSAATEDVAAKLREDVTAIVSKPFEPAKILQTIATTLTPKKRSRR